MHFRIFSNLTKCVSINDVINDAATGIGSNRKALCLGYTSRAGEVLSLTQRYGPVALATCGIEHYHEARSLYDVLGFRKWPLFF